MTYFVSAIKVAFATSIVLLSGISAQAAIQTWIGGTSSDLLDPNNWSGAAVPTVTDSANFINNASANPNPTVAGVWDPQFIRFGDENLTEHTAGEGGPARTFSGTGTISVASAGRIDTWVASGNVTFSNSELRLNRSASLFAATGTDGLGADGASNLIINATTLKAGIGGTGSPTLNAVGADLTITPTVDFAESTANRNLLLRPAAGRTITLTNGISDVLTASNINIRTQGSGGRTILGNSTTWRGNAGIMLSDLEINHNDSLGASGTRNDLNYTQVQSGTDGAGTGALVLTNNITTNEYVYFDARNDFNAQLKSKSGNNTLTGDIELENGNAPAIAQNHYAVQSDGTAGGDFFQLTGAIAYSSDEPALLGSIQLALQGAGNGAISGPIGGFVGSGALQFPLDIVKRGGGTWTLTNAANVYAGMTTVEQGTLSLGSTGAIANTATINVRGGATFDVAAQASFTVGATTAQILKGDGSVSGNVTIAAGSTLAVDYSGSVIDSLAISGALNITSAIVDFNDVGGALTGGPHVFATYGSLVGSAFASVIDLPAGYSINYHYLGNQIALVGSAHPGDFDLDGDVDGADFVAWQTNFPTANGATLAQGDADGDGDVDGADFVVWQTNFPFTPGPAVAPVPEPMGIILLSLGGLGLSFINYRNRSNASKPVATRSRTEETF